MEVRRGLCSELGFGKFVLAHDDQLSNGLLMLLPESGQINSVRMLTGTWPLKEFGAAYEELKAHPEQHVKIMIAP